jgi:DNA-binding NarL/FixJ family response regulator
MAYEYAYSGRYVWQDMAVRGVGVAKRIILADTQVIFRTGAARVLAAEAAFSVVAQCADLPNLEEAVHALRNSIAVFPTSITSDLFGLFEQVEDACSKSVVIVEHGTVLDEELAERADGVVLRSIAGPQLVECLRRVAEGEHCVQRAAAEPVPATDRVGARVLKRLTPKELQIVALVSSGGKNKDIATQLGTKEQVIKNYLRNIYDKMGVSDRLELAIFTQHHRTLADAAQQARTNLSAVA